MEFIKPGTKIDFVGKMKTAAAASTILIAISVALWFTVKPNYGIDFIGGTEVDITFTKQVSIGEVRKVVEGLNLGGVEIKRMGGETVASSSYLIRIQRKEATVQETGGEHVDVAEVVIKALEQKIGAYDRDKLGTSVVGPRAGAELRQKAFTAVLFALVFMLIYIAVRFDFVSGLGGVISMFHDVIITVGFLVLMHREFGLTTIAALLTIVGYSINDTIVIFDRIRESAKKYRSLTFPEQINNAINETLSRTILTSGGTLLAVLSLAVITRGAVQDFALTMIVGIVFGTYSSIFIASALVVFWNAKITPLLEKGKKKKS